MNEQKLGLVVWFMVYVALYILLPASGCSNFLSYIWAPFVSKTKRKYSPVSNNYGRQILHCKHTPFYFLMKRKEKIMMPLIYMWRVAVSQGWLLMKRILSSRNIKRLYASFARFITQGETSIGRTFEYNGSNISIYQTFQF